jgi:ribosomal protein L7/L12
MPAYQQEAQMSGGVVKMEKMSPSKSTAAKREKFVELAQKRTVNAIKAIRVIGKLGNRSAYDYTDTDVSKIVKALNEEIEALKSRMKSSGRPETINFKL